ncbi:MAG: DUF4340 domain-containing protein [Chthoniobacterales bacterium]
MKFRTTLFLLAIAIGLGSMILVLSHQGISSREAQKNTYVVEVDRRKINGLKIENGDNEIELRRAGGSWTMIKPVQDRADSAAIDQLLTTLEFLRPEDTLADLGKGDKRKKKLREFGLAKSKLRLKLEGKNVPGDLQFGNDAAVEGKGYLRVGGEESVLVVSNDLKDIISRKSDSFRDHRLTPFLTTEIDHAIFRSPGGEVELAREHDNWQITRPTKARASNDAVADTLNKINSASIADFIGNDKAIASGLDAPVRMVTLAAGDSRVEIDIGGSVQNDPSKIYVRLAGRPSVFLVDASLSSILDVKPNDLRDRKIMRLNPDLIDRITIDKPGQPNLVLARVQDRWVFANEKNAPADASAVNRLIGTLNNQDVAAFVSDTATDLSRYGLDDTAVKITFSSYASENTAESNAGEVPIATLLLGRTEDGATYARIAEEPYIVSISQNTLAELPSAEIDFRPHH